MIFIFSKFPNFIIRTRKTFSFTPVHHPNPFMFFMCHVVMAGFEPATKTLSRFHSTTELHHISEPTERYALSYPDYKAGASLSMLRRLIKYFIKFLFPSTCSIYLFIKIIPIIQHFLIILGSIHIIIIW